MTDPALTASFDQLADAMGEVARVMASYYHSLIHEGVPKKLAENFTLMLAPFAPHLAEELWQRMGHTSSLAYEPFPVADPDRLTVESVIYPVQVNGKIRGRVEVPAVAAESEVRAAALAEVASALDGRTPRKVIVVPDRLVNIVA